MEHHASEARLESAAAAAGKEAIPSAVLADLYRAHYTGILRLCRRYLRDDAEAEDAAQETFLAAHKSLLGGSVPVWPLAWLRTIARNTCWERSQRRSREPVAASETAGAEGPADAFTDAVISEQRSELLQAVVELPLHQQQAFVLCEVAGHSYAEAAARLAVTESALESLLVRARRQLRRRLRPLAGSLQGVWSLPVSLLNRLGDNVDGVGSAAATAGRVGALPAAVKLAAATVGVAVIGGGSLVARDVGHRPPLARQTARTEAPAYPASRVPTSNRPPAVASPAWATSGARVVAGPTTRASAAGGDRREIDHPSPHTTSDRASVDEHSAPRGDISGGDGETSANAAAASGDGAPTSALPLDGSSPGSGTSGGDSTGGDSGDGRSVAVTTATPESAPAAEGDGSGQGPDSPSSGDQPTAAASDGGDGGTPSG